MPPVAVPTFEVINEWEALPSGWEHPDTAAVAIDSNDRVFVLHRGEHPVMVYDRDGKFVTSWGDGLFTDQTHGITIAPDDSVFVTDRDQHTVRQFTPDGTLLMTLGMPSVPSDTGATGPDFRTVQRAAGPFNCPTNVAIAGNGDLYISDGYANARVHQFSPSGELRRSWGTPGTGPGEFNLPHGIAIASDGRVFVCDRENERVQIFTPDGDYLSEWADVQRPTQISFDRAGCAYVSELPWPAGTVTVGGKAIDAAQPGRISVLSPDGEVIARWSQSNPQAAGAVPAPHGLAIDSRGDLYVADVTATAVRNNWIGEGCSALQKFRRTNPD
jgi:hypothetical protein